MNNINTGKCFCGAVVFEVSGKPNVMGYCHCDDCTHWAAAPINAFSMWPLDSLKIIKGIENINSYSKTGETHRKSCNKCGGGLFSELPELGMVDIYPNVVPGVSHEPTVHVYYSERTVTMKDGLPKFKDLPKEFGGSGETVTE